MVLYHSAYTPQGGAAHASHTLDPAISIAREVLKHFKLDSFEEYQEFLAQTDMFDRGEELDLHMFLKTLQPI